MSLSGSWIRGHGDGTDVIPFHDVARDVSIRAAKLGRPEQIEDRRKFEQSAAEGIQQTDA